MRRTQRHLPEVVFRPPKPPRWAGLELWRIVGGKPTWVWSRRGVRPLALATHRSSLRVFHWHHLGLCDLASERRRACPASRAFRTSLTKACPPDSDGPAGIREKESKQLPCHPGGASGGGLGMRTLGQAMARHCAAWKEAWWHGVVLPKRSAGKSFSVFGHIRFSHGVAQGTSRGPRAVGGSSSVPEGAMKSIVWVTNKRAAAVQLKRARAAVRAKPPATHRFRRRVPRARCRATMPHIGSARRPQRGRHRRGRGRQLQPQVAPCFAFEFSPPGHYFGKRASRRFQEIQPWASLGSLQGRPESNPQAGIDLAHSLSRLRTLADWKEEPAARGRLR